MDYRTCNNSPQARITQLSISRSRNEKLRAKALEKVADLSVEIRDADVQIAELEALVRASEGAEDGVAEVETRRSVVAKAVQEGR
jgi:hypothetical protein